MATVLVLLGSHAAAVAVGYMVWQSGGRDRWGQAGSGDQSRLGTVAGPRLLLSPAEWAEEQLVEVREERRKRNEQIEFEESAGLAERMERNVESVDRFEEKLDEWLAGMRAKADEVAGARDPAADIERRRREGASDEDLLPHVLAWAREDRGAALADLAGWHEMLTWDGLKIGALLRAEFGEEWVCEAVADEATPYPVRLTLAIDAGAAAGMDGGVAQLHRSYERVSDPRLRAMMVHSFIGLWRIEEPGAVAQFLGRVAPPELRDLLLVGWRSPGALRSSWHEWRDAMNKELKNYGLPAYAWEIADTFPLTEAPGFFDPKPPSAEPLDNYQQGSSEEGDRQLASALAWKVRAWIEEGTDLRELYCEGRIPRDELLRELTERIPGSERYPDQLERAAWQVITHCSDPAEAEAWGRELAARGDLSKQIDEGRRNLYYDPRERLQLDRLRVMASLGPKKWVAETLVEDAIEEWTEWRTLSPPDARKWREGLPAGHPLAGPLREASENKADGEEGR